LDEIPKAVVVTLLRAGDGWHGNDHPRFRHTALNSSRTMGSLRQPDDNSRSKVQNVRKDSSGAPQLSDYELATQNAEQEAVDAEGFASMW
jgi:hypothetical protein